MGSWIKALTDARFEWLRSQIFSDAEAVIICSKCGRIFPLEFQGKDFCPECGTQMTVQNEI